MMETIYFEKTKELKSNLHELERKLKVSLILTGRKLTIEGSPLDEYEALRILEAIHFGFSAKKALLLIDPETIFKIIHIKEHSRKKNLYDVRARIIGTLGKTKRTIEEVSDTFIELKENDVGIIGSAEKIEEAITALTSLIRGAKQSNVYNFLEKMNKAKKSEGLGIKNKK